MLGGGDALVDVARGAVMRHPARARVACSPEGWQCGAGHSALRVKTHFLLQNSGWPAP